MPLLADHVALDLPMSAGAPAAARRAIAGMGLTPGAKESASLLVSELVSNAVRHSGAGAAGPIRLRAGIHDQVLRMSVTDSGTGFAPRAMLPQPGVTGGFGLFLVERLSRAWGVETNGGTTVWLELALGL